MGLEWKENKIWREIKKFKGEDSVDSVMYTSEYLNSRYFSSCLFYKWFLAVCTKYNIQLKPGTVPMA